MKKTFIRLLILLGVALLAVLTRYFYPKGEISQPDTPPIPEQVEVEEGSGMMLEEPKELLENNTEITNEELIKQYYQYLGEHNFEKALKLRETETTSIEKLQNNYATIGRIIINDITLLTGNRYSIEVDLIGFKQNNEPQYEEGSYWISPDTRETYRTEKEILDGKIKDISSKRIKIQSIQPDNNYIREKILGEGIYDIVDGDRYVPASDYMYSKDKWFVYLNGDIILGANPSTFKVLGSWYSKDATQVFRGPKRIENADPNSFDFFNRVISKDKKHVYFNWDILVGGDPTTFEVFWLTNPSRDMIAQDKNYTYGLRWIGQPLKVSDITKAEKTSSYDYWNKKFGVVSTDVYFSMENGAPTFYPRIDISTSKWLCYRDHQLCYDKELKGINPNCDKYDSKRCYYVQNKNNIYRVLERGYVTPVSDKETFIFWGDENESYLGYIIRNGGRISQRSRYYDAEDNNYKYNRGKIQDIPENDSNYDYILGRTTANEQLHNYN